MKSAREALTWGVVALLMSFDASGAETTRRFVGPGELHYPPRRPTHRVVSRLEFVDSDRDGRAEVVRLFLPVEFEAPGQWAICLPRLETPPSDRARALVFGSPVGEIRPGDAVRRERILHFTVERKESLEVGIEFDAEELRSQFQGRASVLSFRVDRVLNTEAIAIDGAPYESDVPGIPIQKLGWLPARLLAVESFVEPGQVRFHVRLEADRDAVCKFGMRSFLTRREGRADSIVSVRVAPGVSEHDLMLAVPSAFADSPRDSIVFGLYVGERESFAPGAGWSQSPPMRLPH